MASKNLTINLNPKKDKYQQTYYVGKLKGPVLIDCKDGVSFLIFISEQGEEELQIADMDDE